MKYWEILRVSRAGFAALALLTAFSLPAAPGESGGSRRDGVRYRTLERPEWPLVAHVLEIERGRDDLRFAVSVGAGVQGKETVQEMVEALSEAPETVLAAINGDYFEFRTQPRYFGVVAGLCILGGELTAAGSGPAFCVDSEGVVSILKVRSRLRIEWPDATTSPLGLNCATDDFRAEVRRAGVVLFTPRFGPSTQTGKGRELRLLPADGGDWLPLRAGRGYDAVVGEVDTAGDMAIPDQGLVVSISSRHTSEVPTLRPGERVRIETTFDRDVSGVMTAVAGGPLLLRDGELLPRPHEEPVSHRKRAPRTAVGFNEGHVFFVVVDGRQPGRSMGFTHRELAEFMQELGCTDALNLDGGGSSTFWFDGRVRNVPSGLHPRAVGNSLLLLRRPPSPDGGDDA